MLLPRPEPPDAEDDPRLEIVKPLQELARLKGLADRLDEMPWLHRDVFTREIPLEFESFDSSESGDDTAVPESEFPAVEAGILDLINALQNVLGNSALPRSLEITRARATMSQRMEAIEERLRKADRTTLAELLSADMDRQFLIVTFLALLELAKLSVIRIFQETPGGDVLVVARACAPVSDHEEDS
jgi:segregation and condensation protein A